MHAIKYRQIFLSFSSQEYSLKSHDNNCVQYTLQSTQSTLLPLLCTSSIQTDEKVKIYFFHSFFSLSLHSRQSTVDILPSIIHNSQSRHDKIKSMGFLPLSPFLIFLPFFCLFWRGEIRTSLFPYFWICTWFLVFSLEFGVWHFSTVNSTAHKTTHSCQFA